MAPSSQPRNDEADTLKDCLRQILIEQARTGTLVTYRDLAGRLGLTPPQTIHRLTGLLEGLMVEDAEAGRPLLAALCVRRLRHNMPAPGFFMIAEALGLFVGEPEGPEAKNFHERELARVFPVYRQSHDC
jgi:hypothetical protein